MKIKLNLLPEERKNKIKNKKIIHLFIWQESMLIVATLLILGVVFSVTQIIDIQAKSLDTQVSSNSSEGNYAKIKKYEETLAEAKVRIRNIDKVQKNNIDWINAFNEINKNIPDDITLRSISNNEYVVHLSGRAKDRDELIKMRSQIEKSKCF